MSRGHVHVEDGLELVLVQDGDHVEDVHHEAGRVDHRRQHQLGQHLFVQTWLRLAPASPHVDHQPTKESR